MSPPVDARGVPIVLPHAESPNSRRRTRKIRFGSPDDVYDSSKDEVRLCRMRPDRHSLLEAYDNSSPQRPFAQSYYQQLTRLFNPLHARRRSKEEIHERTGQKRKSSADGTESVRPTKQKKSEVAETSPKPTSHTSDNADAKKEIDTTDEEIVAAQNNARFAETTKEDTKEKNNGEKRISTRKTRSTKMKEEEAVSNTEMDQNEKTTETKQQDGSRKGGKTASARTSSPTRQRKNAAVLDKDSATVNEEKERAENEQDDDSPTVDKEEEQPQGITPGQMPPSPTTTDTGQDNDSKKIEEATDQETAKAEDKIKENNDNVEQKATANVDTSKETKTADTKSGISTADPKIEGPKFSGSSAAKEARKAKEIAEQVKLQEEIEYLNQKVKHLAGNYKIVAKLGEGTFSTVYKAEDLRYDDFDNASWKQQLLASWERTASAFGSTETKPEIATRYVALKRIYCTSSPARIAHEISLLKSLSGCPCVAPMITAFREGDEFFIVMPYIEHDDFRKFFMDMTMEDIKCYVYSLLTGLKHLHSHQVIHRDIKPHNFLYNRQLRTGILIDFGLAESINRRLSKEEYDRRRLALRRRLGRKSKENVAIPGTTAVVPKPPGYLKGDTRPAVHANRAGTRGFRAPEVLFRESYQTGAIDVWSVGVILLSLLSGQFPFFESKDDADSLVEIATLLGLDEMKAFADKLNRTFDTNIKTIPRQAKSLYSVCQSFNEEKFNSWGEDDVRNAVDLLQKCLTLDCDKRITVEEALNHPFFEIFSNNKLNGE